MLDEGEGYYLMVLAAQKRNYCVVVYNKSTQLGHLHFNGFTQIPELIPHV